SGRSGIRGRRPCGGGGTPRPARSGAGTAARGVAAGDDADPPLRRGVRLGRGGAVGMEDALDQLVDAIDDARDDRPGLVQDGADVAARPLAAGPLVLAPFARDVSRERARVLGDALAEVARVAGDPARELLRRTPDVVPLAPLATVVVLVAAIVGHDGCSFRLM